MFGLWRASTTNAVRGIACPERLQFPGRSICSRSLGLCLRQAATPGDGGARSQWPLRFAAISYDRQVEGDPIACRCGIVCRGEPGVEIVLLPVVSSEPRWI